MGRFNVLIGSGKSNILEAIAFGGAAAANKLDNELSVKHGKQVIFTTHNPAILDGLNLHDDEQRLFVVGRNHDGHTKIKRIEEKSKNNGEKRVKLSQAFMNGFLGGLPNNF